MQTPLAQDLKAREQMRPFSYRFRSAHSAHWTQLTGLALVGILALLLVPRVIYAIDPPLPVLTNITLTSTQQILRFDPYPAAQTYTILSGTNLSSPLTPTTNFLLSRYIVSSNTNGTNYSYQWLSTNRGGLSGFYRVQVTPMASNAALSAVALNRLAYGPTPYDLEQIATNGPDWFITNQLAPWNITEDISSQNTNIPYFDAKFAYQTNIVSQPANLNFSEFRAWHCLRAVGARRQFLEILLQFLENHFVTQYSKTLNYLDGLSPDAETAIRVSAQTEYLENVKWRAALLNPQCTFYDLLKISAESPAMIIYLDTVGSKGNGSNVANENYARELLELFCMGVDNGYDQNDITVQSRIWTGWTIDKVAPTDAFNPAAVPLSGSDATNVGVWAFNYKTNVHNNSTKTIFPGKIVPSRFGAPWTTKTYFTNAVPGKYEIVIPGHSTSDTNGISEGYQFITNIANYPFTEEYLSIKLCRLLVHDDFPNPSNDPADDAYNFYNYAAGNLSDEANLVHACMLTWETNSPKGQIWKVLKTITDSALFRSQNAAFQKVKTPLEYFVSVLRALRCSTNGTFAPNSFTADTDGFSFCGTNTANLSPMKNAGNMLLFDRDSPDGYPEAGPPWISVGTVAERLRFVQSFCLSFGQAGHLGWQGGGTNDAGNAVSDIVGLLRTKTPTATWTNAGAVADYFLGLLYPGEGAGNLTLYRSSAVNFLNDGSVDTIPNSTPFSSLAPSGAGSSDYDKRVRGMVAMLFTMQRFHEQ